MQILSDDAKRRKLAYISNFNKKYTKNYCIKLNINNDEDIIDKLDSVSNKVAYIKNLIRQDIMTDDNSRKPEKPD